MKTNLLITNALDRGRLTQIADWTVVGVAVSLPWSTSATSILIVVWLLTLLPTLDVAMIRREVETAAGGLPVLLWLLAVVGMLWADVNWTERVGGLGAFHRLLMIPLLLTQFRRSERGAWVIYGFLASAVIWLLASWILVLAVPGFTWPGKSQMYGVLIRDYIAQSTVFLICGIVLLWPVCDSLRERNWQAALLPAGLAVLFLAYMAFVVVSRTAIIVAPFLVVLLGWRQSGWKGAVAACVAGAVLAAGLWASSPNLRRFLMKSIQQGQAYSATNADTSVGEHIDFVRRSMTFVRDAPLIGHGTGSIAEVFRRSAIGQTGLAGAVAENPHNQIFAVAIQLGLAGAAVLVAMWASHLFLFRAASFTAWVGTVVVVENILSSFAHSHLSDFMHGWLYVFGVGVVGGMVRHQFAADAGQGSGMPATTPMQPVDAHLR